jgi:hypothetical protein
MNNPLVFIIVINYNGTADTMECLESLTELSYSNFNIIVVDNGSSDNSIELSLSEFRDVRLIKNQNNLGFTGGNNIAIKYALENGADYVWLLNNDTVTDKYALTFLVETAMKSDSLGILGSVIYDYHNRNVIQFAGATVDWLNAISPHLIEYTVDNYVERVNGCSMLVSRDVCEKVGLFDENYFLYAEEVDWCIRAINSGFNCAIEPNSKVFHKGSESVKSYGGKNIIYYYYNTRNFLYLINKLCPYYFKKLIIFKLILCYAWQDKRNAIKMLLSFVTGQRLTCLNDAPVLYAVKDYLFNKMGKRI